MGEGGKADDQADTDCLLFPMMLSAVVDEAGQGFGQPGKHEVGSAFKLLEGMVVRGKAKVSLRNEECMESFCVSIRTPALVQRAKVKVL